MNPLSVIENGLKTRFAPELQDMVFLFLFLLFKSNFCSRNERRRAGFLFAGRATKKLPLPIHLDLLSLKP